MVVGALDVDDGAVAAFPFGDVVGHVRHKVGVAAVAFAHDAVFVVAKVGGFEPQCAVLLVGVAVGDEFLYGLLNAAAAVEAALKIVLVKAQGKGFQVNVLLVAQVGYGKLADVVCVLHIAVGGKGAVIGADGFLREKVGGDVGNVVAVVEVFALGVFGVGRPAGITWLEALRAQLHRAGEGFDLHASVVVVELAPDGVALGGQQVADGITQRGLAAVANVQGAGGVGTDEFDQYFFPAGGLRAVLLACGEHFAHDLLLGLRFEADV